MSDNPLVGLGDFGPAAKALVERLSDFIGGAFKPTQIKRVARAEADAAKILASAKIEIDDMQRRAVQRALTDEMREQANIENVVYEALPYLNKDADASKLDEDWLASFFRECRIVSNEEMQRLWAHILAGETNNPGAFSRRTVRLVSDLDRRDAELFIKLCRFAWRIDHATYPVVLNYDEPIYKSNGVNFDNLTHLDAYGLIRFDPNAGFLDEGNHERIACYYGANYHLTSTNDAVDGLQVGEVLFTQSGVELAAICTTTAVPQYPDYAIERWSGQGWKVTPLTAPAIEQAKG